MRLTALVRGINGWFGRVVYERDQWDEKLERWASGDGSDWRLTIVLLVARVSIWASRRVLTGLMIAGHAISCFMLRQMEYRRRQLRSQVRRQRCVCTDVDAHARARARDAAWLC